MQRLIHAQPGGAVCVAAFCGAIGCSEDSSRSAGSRDKVEASTSLARAAAARLR